MTYKNLPLIKQARMTGNTVLFTPKFYGSIEEGIDDFLNKMKG